MLVMDDNTTSHCTRPRLDPLPASSCSLAARGGLECLAPDVRRPSKEVALLSSPASISKENDGEERARVREKGAGRTLKALSTSSRRRPFCCPNESCPGPSGLRSRRSGRSKDQPRAQRIRRTVKGRPGKGGDGEGKGGEERPGEWKKRTDREQSQNFLPLLLERTECQTSQRQA